MIGQTRSPAWERRLLDMALEAIDSHQPVEPVRADRETLKQAYARCAEITAQHSHTFYMASQLLPAEKRQAVRALYAFCRVTDDLVDRSPVDAEASLQEWRWRALSAHPPQDDLVALAWADTRTRYHIPRRYAEQLIDGVGRDIHQKRYATFEELSSYCYGVASTVGLMSMHIVGFSGAEAVPYALKLGVALQLTNILRDVAEDWRAGRLYLPQEELAAFGLTEAAVSEGQITARWQTFLQYQIERNRRLYREAWPGIQLLNPEGRFAIGAAIGLYQAILEDIEAHQGDVFSRRAHINTWGKVRRLPGIWLRTRM